MPSILDIIRPTLVIDEERCRRNIADMQERAAAAAVVFRPHFKTHQSKVVGQWFREMGVTRITVSSVEMAERFIADGWQDVTIAFPFNRREWANLERLPIQSQIQLVVADPITVKVLDQQLTGQRDILIKVDTGYGRSGIETDNRTALQELIRNLNESRHLNFTGFLTHAGHSYRAASHQDILDIHEQTLRQFKALLTDFGPDNGALVLSLGDTPSCTLARSFEPATEIRPGNFVFYDSMMVNLGVCVFEQVAVCLVCPIVARYPHRGKLVIHGGAVHLSKESLQLADGQQIFGYLAQLSNRGWEVLPAENVVTALSQEHGILQISPETMRRFQVGDLIGIVPVHSCLIGAEVPRIILQHQIPVGVIPNDKSPNDA